MNISFQTQLATEFIAGIGERHKDQRGLLISNHWQCRDDIGDDGEWVENLEPILDGLPASIGLILKITLLDLDSLRSYDNCLLVKRATLDGIVSDFRWLARELRCFKVNRLCELDEHQICTLYRNSLKRSPNANSSSNKADIPVSRRHFDRRVNLLQRMEANYRAGLAPDGFLIALTESQYLMLAEPVIRCHFEWKDWLKGGSLGGFPLELALCLLVHSISNISSTETRLVLAVQDAFREHVLRKNPGASLDWRRQRLQNLLRTFKKYCDRADESMGTFRSRFYPALCDAYRRREGSLDDISPSIIKSVSDYNLFRNQAAYSCLSIIMITSGIRLSELKSLNRSSFRVDEYGNAYFISKIKKTNHSIETERPITNLAYEAYTLLVDLDMNRDRKPTDSLFEIEGISNHLSVLTEKNTYKKWIIFTLKNLLADFNPENHPKVSPHRFRHTWAELALRRFDGNVHEAVRSHFRHSMGSWMTMRYLREKYHEDDMKISREYTLELIGRAAYGKEQLFGPVGRFILNKLSEIEAVSPEDIERIADEFDFVDPHEYGYCMIPRAQRFQAKCFDKNSQSPKFNQAKFELCGGCIGCLRLANHKDAIIRIGMAAQEHARIFDELGYRAVTELSKRTMKLCESALKDFDRRADIGNKDRKAPYV